MMESFIIDVKFQSHVTQELSVDFMTSGDFFFWYY